MSWYTDRQLFIYGKRFLSVYRITKEFGVNPIASSDLEDGEILNFSKHLSLGNNKESDFDAFRVSFPVSGIFKFINSQGLVINWDLANETGTWSHEELNSPFWTLPGILPEPILAQLRSLEKENSELKSNNSSLEDDMKKLNEDLSKYQVTVTKLQKQIKHLKEQVANSKSSS